MSIDHAIVRRIARLARIGMGDDEIAPVASELTRILELADQLAAADREDFEPFAHAQSMKLRADAVTETDRADEFLALAPDARGGLYLVPKVLE
jgi:aspartyl-tRNA(Asn)/glutamyl-tRNA(Gln) amidotransferase subunit C